MCLPISLCSVKSTLANHFGGANTAFGDLAVTPTFCPPSRRWFDLSQSRDKPLSVPLVAQRETDTSIASTIDANQVPLNLVEIFIGEALLGREFVDVRIARMAAFLAGRFQSLRLVEIDELNFSFP